jgi:hypothetical protein
LAAGEQAPRNGNSAVNGEKDLIEVIVLLPSSWRPFDRGLFCAGHGFALTSFSKWADSVGFHHARRRARREHKGFAGHVCIEVRGDLRTRDLFRLST